jgi:hypothetical protein
MVVVVSEKRCGFYMHSSKKNDYKEAPEEFLTLLMKSKTIDIQNLTLGDEILKVMWSQWVSWHLNLPGS